MHQPWDPAKDHLICLTKACIEMGSAPNWSMAIDVLPVDIVSKIIFSISLLKESNQQVYNIFNPKGNTWENYMLLVEKSTGKHIQIISKEEWLAKVQLELLYEGFPLLPFKDLYSKNNSWLSEQEIQAPFSIENTITT